MAAHACHRAQHKAITAVPDVFGDVTTVVHLVEGGTIPTHQNR
jgi:hypothetical protein